jgi:hypothetical protein
MAFLIVRISYALISVYVTEPNSKWNFETGSSILFICLALLPEYLVVGVIVYIGLNLSNANNIYEERDDPPRYEDLNSDIVKKDYEVRRVD